MDLTKYNGIVNNSWYLSTNSSDPPLNWPLSLRLISNQYFFEPNTNNSTIKITMNVSTLSTQSDMFYTFAVNNKYFSFAHDWDGTIKIPILTGPNALGIYPQCNNLLNSGDASSLMQNNVADDSDSLRQSLGNKIDATSWYPITTNMNGDARIVNFEFINNDIDNLLTFKFYSATTNATCTYSESLDTNTDFYMYITPDIDNEKILVNEFDISATSDIPPTAGPTENPTTNPTLNPSTSAPSTINPTINPTMNPTINPTSSVPTTSNPTANPTDYPSIHPTTSNPTTYVPTTSFNPTTHSSITEVVTNEQGIDESSTMSEHHEVSGTIMCEYDKIDESLSSMSFSDMLNIDSILMSIILSFIFGVLFCGIIFIFGYCFYKKKQKKYDITPMEKTKSDSVDKTNITQIFHTEMIDIDINTQLGDTMKHATVEYNNQHGNAAINNNIVNDYDKDSNGDDDMDEQLYRNDGNHVTLGDTLK